MRRPLKTTEIIADTVFMDIYIVYYQTGVKPTVELKALEFAGLRYENFDARTKGTLPALSASGALQNAASSVAALALSSILLF